MNVKEAIRYKNIDWTEAQILLSFVLKSDKLFLISHDDYVLKKNEEKEYINCVEERLKGVPIAYITHQREFYGRKFYVDENVLVPRPETELIIDVVKSLSISKRIKILDLCTGSGIIPITLSLQIPEAFVIGIDISENALNVAKKNNEVLGTQVTFIQSDMFENVPQERFDIITSNPPYIPTEDLKGLDSDVQREPSIALDGGGDGLDFYKIILSQVKDYLNEKGFIVLEIGYNQSEDIKLLAEKNNFNVKFYKDLQGYNRVALLWQNI